MDALIRPYSAILMAVGIFLLLFSGFWIWHPSFAFGPGGGALEFGSETLFPIWWCVVTMAALSFVLMVHLRAYKL
jgi:hypothetical protein